jgi:hypothetical protein
MLALLLALAAIPAAAQPPGGSPSSTPRATKSETPAPAPSVTAESLAILVVGNKHNAAMDALEVETIKALAANRTRYGLAREDLPIIAYHFDKPEEKKYCEKALDIKPDDLLFVGIVKRENNVARKVIYRAKVAKSPTDAANAIMGKVAALMGLDPALAETSPSPSPLPRGVSVEKVVIEGADGQPRDRFSLDDPGVFVSVYLHNDNPAELQQHMLSMKFIGPDGKVFERSFGGAFSVKPGEKLEGVDMVKRTDIEHHNGLLIHGHLMGQTPGSYKAQVEIDGEVASTTPFVVGDGPGAGVGGIPTGWLVTAAWLSDEAGAHRRDFKTSDAGVWVSVKLRMTSPNGSPKHDFKVTLFQPDGTIYGRPLGGEFSVTNPVDLSNKTFPIDADPDRHSGFLIKGHHMASHPGQYRVVIDVDKKTVRVLNFRITE